MPNRRAVAEVTGPMEATRTPARASRPAAATKFLTVEELVKAALENAVAIVKSIRKGEFPAVPADDRVCEYCNLGHTCGFTETAKDSEMPHGSPPLVTRNSQLDGFNSGTSR